MVGRYRTGTTPESCPDFKSIFSETTTTQSHDVASKILPTKLHQSTNEKIALRHTHTSTANILPHLLWPRRCFRFLFFPPNIGGRFNRLALGWSSRNFATCSVATQIYKCTSKICGPPPKMAARNIKISARFWTTSRLDCDYLQCNSVVFFWTLTSGMLRGDAFCNNVLRITIQKLAKNSV